MRKSITRTLLAFIGGMALALFAITPTGAETPPPGGESDLAPPGEPILTISQDVSAYEGDGAITYTLTRTISHEQASVPVSIEHMTTSDDDFLWVPTMLLMDPGESELEFALVLRADDAVEPAERFRLHVVTDSGEFIIGDPVTDGTIHDGDQPDNDVEDTPDDACDQPAPDGATPTSAAPPEHPGASADIADPPLDPAAVNSAERHRTTAAGDRPSASSIALLLLILGASAGGAVLAVRRLLPAPAVTTGSRS